MVLEYASIEHIQGAIQSPLVREVVLGSLVLTGIIHL